MKHKVGTLKLSQNPPTRNQSFMCREIVPDKNNSLMWDDLVLTQIFKK